MDRVLSVKCVRSLATDVATCLVLGDEVPPQLDEELNALDGLSRTRIEFFILGAQWQRDEAPILLAMAEPAVKAEPKPPKAAADCWDRAAKAEIRLRHGLTLAAIIVTAALTLLAFQVSINNDRVAEDVRRERVMD